MSILKAVAPEVPREITPEIIPAAAPPTGIKRPSPSPSVKRGKAERLLKEHGSPPGLRVTAGGRIVPGDLPPLGTRPSFNIYNPHALRAAPGNVMAAQSQPVSDSTARIEVIGGQPVVVVGDRLFALPTVNSGSVVPTAAPAVDEILAIHVNEGNTLSDQSALPGLSFAPARTNSQTPFTGLDLPTLKTQQAVQKQELRSVEQTEVLHSSHQTEAWRSSMIEKKRNLIVELDALRKQISALEADSATATQDAPPNPLGAVVQTAPMASFMPPYQQPLSHSLYGYPPSNPYAPMVMYPPTFSAFSSFPTAEPAPFVQPAVNPLPHSPGSGKRRSRAIEIKPPHEELKKAVLDPKSPMYEPKGNTSTKLALAVPPTPSPDKRSLWRQQEQCQSDTQPHYKLSHKLSLSSVDTTDFFPTNTHEHSSTRVAPTFGVQQLAPDENKIVPVTPEKNWPASPWNEGTTSRARNEESAPRIGLWPEAFGKPQSLSPLKHEAMDSTSVPEGSFTLQTACSLRCTANNNTPSQSQHQQRIATEESWPFNMPKAIVHIPSTYQEGYQAGYDHVGMPDSPEVLQGYVQGLLNFIAETLDSRQSSASTRRSQVQMLGSRKPSLHGLIAGSGPHDSAISMTFNRSEVLVGDQENVRVSQGNGTTTSRRDSAYNQHGAIRNAPVSLAPGIEFTEQLRQSIDPIATCPNPAGLFPERMSNGLRIAPYTTPDFDMSKTLEKGVAPRSALKATNNDFGRQFQGNQLTDRTNANPQTLQRFSSTHKETSTSAFGGNGMSAAPPLADNRVSGLDGAMDDLAGLVMETSVEERRSPVDHSAHSTAASMSVDGEESGASCFKPSSGKGKQKAAAEPTKPIASAPETITYSPANVPSSPKRSGEHSPTKAKLEQVTNKFRRGKKEDPRGLSSEGKVKRSEKWRKRFQYIKDVEQQEIKEYCDEDKRRGGGRH